MVLGVVLDGQGWLIVSLFLFIFVFSSLPCILRESLRLRLIHLLLASSCHLFLLDFVSGFVGVYITCFDGAGFRQTGIAGVTDTLLSFELILIIGEWSSSVG